MKTKIYILLLLLFCLPLSSRAQNTSVSQQFVAITVEPKTATVILNGENLPLNNGTASKMMPFGTYDYRVECNMYHPQVGKLVVNDPDNTVTLNVKLRPNFGYIDISGDQANGSSVYIDNEPKGTVPFRSAPIASGNHNVKVVKNLYKPFEQNVVVTDGQHTSLTPQLEPDFVRLTWKVEGNAEIWINNQKSGEGSVTGDYTAGAYRVETKKKNHRAKVQDFTVTASMMGHVIQLNSPEPIMGSLLVSSSPIGATITIDGQDYGKTPRQINKILIGSHKVTLSLDNYYTETANVTVEEGKTATIEKTLQKSQSVYISCTPTSAKLYLDGAYLGQGTGNYNLPYGRHTLKAESDQYQPWEQTIEVSSATSKCMIQMRLIFANKTFTVDGVSFTMVAVKGGTFTMGATSEQGSDADDDEKPTHRVTLSNYYIGSTEVTQALWQAVMGSNPSYFKGDNLPVEQVSWDDCQEFIRKLNAKTGMKFRLPTETEWEYAARGGSKSRGYKYSGSNNLADVAWYEGNSDATRPVGTKQANELGLYDMAGNVYEWCHDSYESYSTDLQTNPKGPSTGSLRVHRGGSWFSDAWYCRVSIRLSTASGAYSGNLGLRLALSE